MTNRGGSFPTQQNCPSCNALVYYEGYSVMPANLVPHRFHCHACDNVYLVRSTSNKPPRFRITMRHAATAPGDRAMAEAIAQQGHDQAPAPGAGADLESDDNERTE